MRQAMPCTQPSSMSSSATSARKLMSMMATFMASLPPSMVPRAMAPIRFSSCVQLVLGDHDLAFGGWHFGLGHQHLGHQDGSRRGHDDRREQVPRFDALRDVHGHDAARHVRHAAGHDGHQLAARGLRRNGRMVSGASVCPMKIEAATFMLSAPEMRMVLSMTHAMPRMMICMTPM